VLCCETYSLHTLLRDKKLTLEQIPALYRELGIPGISWNDLFFESWDNDYYEKLKRAAALAGRQTCCLIMEGNLATGDADARRKQIEEDAMKLRAAKAIGAQVVRINLGHTEKDEDNATLGVERCIAAFKELLPLAKELGVRISMENHGGVSLKADWILQVIRGTDPAWVGSCLDFGNWPAEPKELRYEEIAKLVPHAFHTHVKPKKFRPDGEDEVVDHARVFAMLKKAGYTGAISVEWEGSDPADPIEGVKRCRDLINRHWDSAGR